MKYLLPVIACFIPAALTAGPFGSVSVLAETTSTDPLVAGDRLVTGVSPAKLNNDTLPDLLAWSGSSDEVFWLDLSTAPVGTQLVSDSVKSVATALPVDVDGDNDLDVVVSSRWDRNLVSFINDGSGNFSSGSTLLSSIDTVVSIAVADVDDSGLDDIIAVSDHDRELFWLSQTSTGVYGSKQVLANYAQSPIQVVAQDVTGDTIADLLVLSGGRVLVYENDGAAGFTVTAYLGDGAVTAFQVADVNGEQPDVITTSRVSGVCTFYGNDNSGGFDAGVTLSAAQPGWDIVAVADMDHDSQLDLLLASYSEAKLRWWKGNGISGFNMQSPDIPVNAGPATATLADHDGDQDLDLVLTSVRGEDLALYQGLGSNPYTFWSFDHVTDPSTLLQSGDANGDGIDNLMHYATNTSPTEINAGTPYLTLTTGVAGLPVQTVDSGSAASFEFVRRTNARPHGLSYVVQSSSTLSGWNAVTLNGDNSEVTAIDADWERVRYTFSISGSASQFHRLLINFSAP